MRAADLDTMKDVLVELIDIQRNLSSFLPSTEAEGLSARLDALTSMLEGIGSAESGLALTAVQAEQLSIVEPDGVTRLLATCAAREPRQRGGLLFFSQEGRECGGLVYSAEEGADGPEAWGLLAFDQFRQDQIVGVRYADARGERTAGFFVWDRPDIDIAELMDRIARIQQMERGTERDEAWEVVLREGRMGRHWPTRLFAGRTADNDAALELRDVEGRIRLRISVAADGEAEIRFVDADGASTRVLSGTG